MVLSIELKFHHEVSRGPDKNKPIVGEWLINIETNKSQFYTTTAATRQGLWQWKWLAKFNRQAMHIRIHFQTFTTSTSILHHFEFYDSNFPEPDGDDSGAGFVYSGYSWLPSRFAVWLMERGIGQYVRLTGGYGRVKWWRRHICKTEFQLKPRRGRLGTSFFIFLSPTVNESVEGDNRVSLPFEFGVKHLQRIHNFDSLSSFSSWAILSG